MGNTPYGGLAVHPFPVAPASLDDAGSYFRWRKKPGYTPTVEFKPVKASEVIRLNDFLKVTSGQVERALDPDGDAGANSSGGATTPTMIALAGNITTDASVDGLDTIPVLQTTLLQFLFRMYHATAATSGPDNVTLALPGVTSSVYYEWGYWEIGTGSDNYQPYIDVANQDDTNGEFKVVEWLTGTQATENFALGWVETTGK